MITIHEYQQRRQQLAERLPSNTIVIIPGAKELLRNGDAHYRFRQDSHFYYLTGFSEPEAILVLVTGKKAMNGSMTFESYLFNQCRDPSQEQWTGKRLGQVDAPAVLGVDAAYPIETYKRRLPELCADKCAIYYPMGQSLERRKPILDLLKAWSAAKAKVRHGVRAPEALHDLAPLISEMRVFKSPAELILMRKAMTASVNAHQRAMMMCTQLPSESALEAEWLYGLFQGGCRDLAYEPIVGSGPNSCILHYTKNNQPFQPNDLVLVDAGGEFENYAADITRTYPVKGQFTPEQTLIYDLVLRAQRAGIACIKPGIAWNKVQETIVEILTEGLIDLGLLHGTKEDLIAENGYKPFYMHGSGHWLGLDVHDAGLYKISGEWRSFEPGMVLTVEPGIYIQPGMKGVDERWWNIGVRIEDNILVTSMGSEIMTESLPVERSDLEAVLRG
ncbi:MAG: aminopeptidase P N-terminal domain-containing protein [Legionella sp.]|nr:aminopeptidase P N-terminal domain-containing protein [Legionella sp.]